MTQIDLAKKFPSMIPIKSAPALFRVNGFGVGLYGHRDEDAETGTHVATWCLSLLFVPCLCFRAYRVARGMNGRWYFIGREPLSTLARTWNITVLAAVLATIAHLSISAYTSSPAYKARRQMAEARSLVGTGRLADGARIYQNLAIAGAEEAGNATDALKSLLDNECPRAPLSESAGVFASAAQVARRRTGIAISDVAEKGLKLANQQGDADPRAGVAMLDAVRPLVVDTRPIDVRRLGLLRKWAASEPGNLDVVCPLASLLEQQNQLEEAKSLLTPVKDKLGTGEGARVLGTILGRQGDHEGAYALLWPYVKPRLDQLHAAEKTAEDTGQQIWDREIQRLSDGKASQEFYGKYKAASKDEQRAMVHEYMNGRLKADPQFTAAQESLERETGVVPVALDLGIIMLQRAQAQADTAVRKEQLQSAEQVFLSIGGVAGQTDAYRLSLGQVYYWLGKQAEGRKLFDEFLASKNRTYEPLLGIAAKLREVGAEPEARALAEEAYGKTSKPEEQYAAANLRAACDKDLDDEIAWLKKADPADPLIKGRLAGALGRKAFEEGHDEEAVRQYRAAIDTYSTMRRSAEMLNQGAIAYHAIFQITGDRQALERCLDYFQQAVDLEPSDSILLYNAGIILSQAAAVDIIGSDIDLRALRQPGGFELLGYLYQDQAGRDALVERVKHHPGITRALSYFGKLMVLAPKHVRAYAAAYDIHQFTHDEAALRSLEQRIKAADVGTSDELAQTKEFLSGAKDQQQKVSLTAAIKRSEDVGNTLRAKGGRTAAVAFDQQARGLTSLDLLTDPEDLQKVFGLAEEAYRLGPSTRTLGTLVTAHLLRASKELRSKEPAFDAVYQKYRRSLGVSYLMAWAASEPGPLQQKVLQHPDVQRAVALVREESARFTEGCSVYEWALLKNADKAEADRAAARIRAIPRRQLEQSISMSLNPASAGEAMETYWLMQILGKPEEGRAALRRVADLGIPVPIQP